MCKLHLFLQSRIWSKSVPYWVVWSQSKVHPWNDSCLTVKYPERFKIWDIKWVGRSKLSQAGSALPGPSKVLWTVVPPGRSSTLHSAPPSSAFQKHKGNTGWVVALQCWTCVLHTDNSTVPTDLQLLELQVNYIYLFLRICWINEPVIFTKLRGR